MKSSMHSEEHPPPPAVHHKDSMAPLGLLSQSCYDRYRHLTPRNPELSLNLSRGVEIITRTFMFLHSSYHSCDGAPIMGRGKERETNEEQRRGTERDDNGKYARQWRGAKKGTREEKILHDKVANDKSSAATTLSYCEPSTGCMDAMRLRTYPPLQTPPMTNEVDTELSDDSRSELFVGDDVSGKLCFPVFKLDLKKRSRSVGIFWRGVPLISETLSLFFTSAPRSLQQLLWVDASPAAVAMWGRDRGKSEEAKAHYASCLQALCVYSISHI